jgi:uncharacterized repeat protein (TIGR01451 family)
MNAHPSRVVPRPRFSGFGRKVIGALAVLSLLLSTMFVPTVQAAAGSIKTTDSTCNVVNGNVNYPNKQAVYLHGDQLPPGTYDIIIESPQGTLLGESTGGALTVGANGQFVQCYQLWALSKHASAPNVVGFDDTDNAGNEYKVTLVDPVTRAPLKSDNFKASLSPSLSITKGVSLNQAGPFAASLTTVEGTTIWYQIVVTNTGTADLTGFTLTDSLGLPATCPAVPATLFVGQTYTCVYSRQAAAGTTTNTATADSSKTPPASDSATVNAAAARPGLSITKGVSLNQAGPFAASLDTAPGTTVWFQIAVTNTGNVPLTGVTITDSVGLPGTCPAVPATLAVGATYTCV